ncbi:LPXTG cell wall anchor domain-containing protein [Streptomyces yaanensis]|uniref:LPXTG cell wall anchor domain-containing protein n=1 Tax=Streptomyces yaanensis TaxID=1142239 RepID=A0ABV7S9D2_9ACTN|nr:LPXTG cell wall anchor domain-containing protein [Streptomyces sp. CGMCC 4.7035]WNC02358.1 LPXTG cell wall anchor domain-containing protein [Streptomyces sp. CGMCC 4.7035]
MRTLTRAGALVAVASAALLTAPSAHASAPGDNGDVKIHKSSTDESDQRNEPHVCSFYLDAFNFDGLQQVDWHIEVWAPTGKPKGETVKTGDITLDTEGHGRTADMTLPDGHYKLFWNFDGEKGRAKQKVFWTDCSDDQGGGSTPSGSPSASASASPSASASASVSPSGSAGVSASPSSSSGTGASASASPSAQGGSGGLAETGSSAPVGVLSALAAALVAAGGYLVLRRRKVSQG